MKMINKKNLIEQIKTFEFNKFSDDEAEIDEFARGYNKCMDDIINILIRRFDLDEEE